MPDGQSFKLGKIGEIPNPDASDRLAVLVADQMRGGKIVAVEFLFEWASLLAHVDRAADGDHARHFVHRPNGQTSAGWARTIRRSALPERTRAARAPAAPLWLPAVNRG